MPKPAAAGPDLLDHKSFMPPSRPSNFHSHRLLLKLQSVATLPAEDKAALIRLPMTVARISADTDIQREGDRPSACCLLLEGYACRYRVLAGGQRQIMSFHTPGDIVDLQSLHLQVMDHSIAALVPSQVAFIPHQALHDLIQQHPRLGAALWRDTLIDAAIFREWLVGIGRRSSYARIAHLFCELIYKLKAVGLGEGPTFELPITQGELADALGISDVHVNRVLQQLRAEGLIRLRRGALTVLDWQGLISAGEFDPAYLHQAA
jgi:CRP-like cAMP-binding protein